MQDLWEEYRREHREELKAHRNELWKADNNSDDSPWRIQVGKSEGEFCNKMSGLNPLRGLKLAFSSKAPSKNWNRCLEATNTMGTLKPTLSKMAPSIMKIFL